MDIPYPAKGNRAEWMEAATSPMMLGLILTRHYNYRGLDGQIFTPYEHIVELDELLVALCDGRLYESGPGPTPYIEAKYRPTKSTKRGLKTVVHLDWWDTTDDDGETINPEDWVLHSTKPYHPSKPGESLVNRLGVFLPIRHGKSMMCSLLLPVWYVLQNPATSVMVVGHTKDFGQDVLGGRVQNFLNNYMGIIGLVNPDPKLSKGRMNFKYGSNLSTVIFSGVDVGVLGQAKRLGVLDDPVKSLKEMESEPFRERQYQFYAGEWLGRATLVPGQPPPVDVNVMSRIGLDDIAGRYIIEPGTFASPRKGYYVLHRSGLVKDEFGEHALCEPMVTTSRLLEARDLDPQVFQAQYQNDPKPVKGLGFPPMDSWPKYTTLPTTHNQLPVYKIDDIDDDIFPDVRICSIDLSGKVTNKSDFTVVGIYDYSLTYDMLFVRWITRLRLEAADHMGVIKNAANIPGERLPDYGVTESVALSYNLLQLAERDPEFLGFPVMASNRPGGSQGPKALSKMQRFRLYADFVENRRVVVPKNVFDIPWYTDFEAEHDTWPKTAHDDQLDTSADACFEIQRIKDDHGEEPEERPVVAQGGQWVYNRDEQEHVGSRRAMEESGVYNPLSEMGYNDWSTLGR